MPVRRREEGPKPVRSGSDVQEDGLAIALQADVEAPGVVAFRVRRGQKGVAPGLAVDGAQQRVGGVRHVGAWFSFATPFDIEKNYDSEHAQAFLFGNRKSLVVSPQLETERIVKKLLAGGSAEARKMKRLLGEENIASEYAALDLCLTTTPEPVRLSSSIQELSRTTLMLILKKAFSGLGDVIYRFSLGETKGFQFGNPATASDVYVYLFNPSDRMFRMKFTSLTQGEIDFFLTSIDFFAPPNRTRPG